jgi:hypothetical protein
LFRYQVWLDYLPNYNANHSYTYYFSSLTTSVLKELIGTVYHMYWYHKSNHQRTERTYRNRVPQLPVQRKPDHQCTEMVYTNRVLKLKVHWSRTTNILKEHKETMYHSYRYKGSPTTNVQNGIYKPCTEAKGTLK